ncbi:phosphomannomutase [Pontiella sulfatireligans]|uniref:Phosphoglucosamine mutase n=1 Tax=Pontiella sulfatireligans TaxID=2750658 RepID=A0A6C2UN92_9BACT|nr:phosphomannomutase [Pontiella sulfatireligans]VGO20516.1 Phosphoglucosamine mutase [Pontiella sulfatireligans]
MEIKINDLMQQSGVKFGTSGARGLAVEMTDQVCYTYAKGFLQYLEESGELKKNGESVAIAGDLRPSTERIMGAVAKAASDMGYVPVNCGFIPSPAVALYGITHGCPAIMVTGSHIPADRNGIKFNKCTGEILKYDEEQIREQIVDVDESIFGEEGFGLPEVNIDARIDYVRRYLSAFPEDCLQGKKVGIYQHSAVGRDVLIEIFSGLGADVTPLGFSTTFVPVDTEAIREEDVELAREWSAENGFDVILSTDGDSDRPLVSDENGVWLRGDVACILAAKYLDADSASTPVSCNTALEKCGWFKDIRRTRIGSPFVVASMIEASFAGCKGVIGYEANGGFLTNSDFTVFGKELRALPTRDAVLPVLAIILLSIQERKPISALLADLPQRFTASDRIQGFPTEESRKILEQFEEVSAIEEAFGNAFGKVESIDRTDGLRVTFESSEVLHMRPSGNAPEFRCYNEADSEARVQEMQRVSMEILMRMKSDA